MAFTLHIYRLYHRTLIYIDTKSLLIIIFTAFMIMKFTLLRSRILKTNKLDNVF